MLRTSLCKNQTSWKMEIFKPPSNFAYSQALRGLHKNALLEGCSTLVAMVTTAASSRPGALFSYKNAAKKMKCLFLYLRLNTTLQIRLHFDKFNFPLTSYDLYSQILSVQERSIEVFLFFFCVFFVLVVFTSESGNLLIHRKMSISRLLWENFMEKYSVTLS